MALIIGFFLFVSTISFVVGLHVALLRIIKMSAK